MHNDEVNLGTGTVVHINGIGNEKWEASVAPRLRQTEMTTMMKAHSYADRRGKWAHKKKKNADKTNFHFEIPNEPSVSAVNVTIVNSSNCVYNMLIVRALQLSPQLVISFEIISKNHRKRSHPTCSSCSVTWEKMTQFILKRHKSVHV